jgi:hypothetical protein
MISNNVNHLVESWYSTKNISFLNELFKTIQKNDAKYFLSQIRDEDEAKDVLQKLYQHLFERLSNPEKPSIENFFAFYLKTRKAFVQDYFREKQKSKKLLQPIEIEDSIEKNLHYKAEKITTQTTLSQLVSKISKEFLETQLPKQRDKIMWQELAENGLRGGELTTAVNLQLADKFYSVSTITTQTQRLLEKFKHFARKKLKLLGEYP